MLMPSPRGATPGTTLIASTVIPARGALATVLIGDTAASTEVTTTRSLTLIIPITVGDITIPTTGTGIALIITITHITGILATKRTTGKFPKELNPIWEAIPVMPETPLLQKD